MENATMELAKNIHLETERLYLRPVTLKDIDDFYEISSDPEVVRYLSYERHKNKQDTACVIANYYMKHPLGKYGIELKETGKLIGTIDLRIRSEEVGEVGYQLGSRYHRQGYMSEAVEKILELAFCEVKLRRVIAMCMPENIASQSLLKKVGLQKAHITQQLFYKDHRMHSLILYRINAEEFHNKKSFE